MPLTPDQRELLRKRLRANVSFRKTVRTSGVSNAQEVLQRYNQEQREDEKKLMQDMIQEMKDCLVKVLEEFDEPLFKSLKQFRDQYNFQSLAGEIDRIVDWKKTFSHILS